MKNDKQKKVDINVWLVHEDYNQDIVTASSSNPHWHGYTSDMTALDLSSDIGTINAKIVCLFRLSRSWLF